MIPLVGNDEGVASSRASMVRRVADGGDARSRASTIDYLVGTMIEIPRAALIADELAEEAEFFSFGTNDLTQMTFGYSPRRRRLVPARVRREEDPAEGPVRVDRPGRRRRSSSASARERGRSANPKLKVGVCGEHGGDPDSIRFFRAVGLELRVVLTLPRAGRAPRRRAGGAGAEGVRRVGPAACASNNPSSAFGTFSPHEGRRLSIRVGPECVQSDRRGTHNRGPSPLVRGEGAEGG